jgi:glyoxylase-like metal-dependent hydrolase (beta-lactamase superfamily II)
MPDPIQIEVFCGGFAETNGYLLIHQKEALAFDAPEGMADWLVALCKNSHLQLHALILTHGHWDHIVDAKAIQSRLKTPVWIHQDSAPLLLEPSIQSSYNPFIQIEPCTPDRVIQTESSETEGTFQFEWRLCPGHCPGPLGSKVELLTSIKSKLLTLPPEVKVFPGHGPSTTIGEEKISNPFLR